MIDERSSENYDETNIAIIDFYLYYSELYRLIHLLIHLPKIF